VPNVIKIDPYNFELYRFKFGAFFLRHSVVTTCSMIECHVVAVPQSVPAVTLHDSPSSADPYSYTWQASYVDVSSHVCVEPVLRLSHVSLHPAPVYTADTENNFR